MPLADHYDLLNQLHDGRSVTVYRGRERKSGASVVLKILKPGSPAANQLRNEHSIRKDLAISRIVPVRDFIDLDGELALVLEDLAGETLRHRLRRGPLPLDEALRIASEMADGLAQIHHHRVIHKDLNPSNLLLDRDGRLYIFDFDLATRLPREMQSILTSNQLVGSLPYLSPEQTGRMNRAVDYRTDLYALGITLYEMLTGHVPFQSHDPLELVHCHLAELPTPPTSLDPQIPTVVSDIVMKLLEKAAEARYHSALGLKADLDRCRQQLTSDGAIQPFRLAQGDTSDRFQIPQKIYGRALEIAALEASFARTRKGTPELVLVAGSSGIGKSSVIHELYRSLSQSRGYFVSGKFDQLKRDIPYVALLQALSELVRGLLSETEAELEPLRRRILAAAGGAGRVLTDALPNLVHLIGPQPPVPDLGAAEGRNRFRLVFQSFIQVFTRHGRPLVIFLDDLQWADAATLDLLPALLGGQGDGALLLIGAYRDNEIDATHPLLSTLAELEKNGRRPTPIALGPISLSDVSSMVQDTLALPQDDALPLAEFVWRRTAGNPLFAAELLTMLYKNSLIEFDPTRRCWTYSLARIERAPSTDHVGELMAARAAALSLPTQEVLKLASALGDRFTLDTLALVSARSPHLISGALDEALIEGLILSVGVGQQGEYRFVHDRVQQAVYTLMPQDARIDVHYRTGQLLLQHRPEDNLDQWLFDVLHHLNLAEARMRDPAERFELATLNDRAAKRARASGAASAAINHYLAGIRFLPEGAWLTHHDLMFSMHLGRAECEYVVHNYAATEQIAALLLRHARTDEERIFTNELLATYKVHLSKYDEALALQIKSLGMLGVKLTAKPKPPQLLVELLKTKRALKGRSPGDLSNLPDVTDPRLQLAQRMLTAVGALAFVTDQNLYATVVLAMLRLSIKHGNVAESANTYSNYGLMLIILFGSYDEAWEFGKTALRLAERYDEKRSLAQVKNVYGYFLHPWHRPMKEGLRYTEEARQAGIMSGVPLYMGYAVLCAMILRFMIGHTLDSVGEACERDLELLQRLKHDFADAIIRSLYQATLALRGLTRNCGSFDTADFDEAAHLARISKPSTQQELHVHWLFKLMSLYILGRHDDALAIAEACRKNVKVLSAMPLIVDFYYYDALLLASRALQKDFLARERDLLVIRGHLRKLKKWADLAPMNFRHKYLLVGAELARLTGDDHAALGRYDEAIALANDNGFIQDEAIALELTSKMYAARNLTSSAIQHLFRSRRAYERWGARAKVALIDEAYPGLAARAEDHTSAGLSVSSSTSSTSASDALDAPSIIKAARALSSETSLDKLLLRMMTIVATNAGAERGALLLNKGGSLVVVAEFSTRGGARLLEPPVPITHSTNLSPGIVTYVARTREPVILSDAAADGDFASDEYIASRKIKAVLCAPLLEKGDVSGILYLENNLVPGAFTPERADFLSVLCAQMAISIDNALLYADLERKVNERTRALEQAQARLVQLEKEATETQMAGGFAHEMRNALAAAQIALSKVYKDTGTKEPWSASIDNSNKVATFFSKMSDRSPEDIASESVKLVQDVNTTEKRIHGTLRMIHRALVRGLGITELILRYSQIGRELRGDEQISLSTLVSSILQELEDEFATHRIAVDVAISPQCTLTGNEMHFHSILKNLVNNARDALLETNDGRSRQLSIAADEENSRLVITVRDTGPGIPAELREKIFEPFFSTKPHTGTGLGLGMVRKLASLYGGTVDCESEPPNGATFRLVFPEALDAAADRP